MLVVHIVGQLEIGGAERLLQKLILPMRRRYESDRHVVLSLSDVGPVGRSLLADGIEVRGLGLSSWVKLPSVFWRLRNALIELNPDAVQTWLYHADFLGGLACRSCGIKAVFWGIHSTRVDVGVSWSTRMLRSLCARLSYVVPSKVVCVAEAARRVHIQAGYAPSRLRVIPNGFSLPNLESRVQMRDAVRQSLWGGAEIFVVGSVGRFNADKDPRTFVLAAQIVADRHPAARFLMVGRGLDESNEDLMRWIKSTGHAARFKLMGEQTDVLPYLVSMDVFCLHSVTEALPLVLGEAMAAAVPCITTDVGDAAVLLGNAGEVVPPADAEQIAAAVVRIMSRQEQERISLGKASRVRIEDCYNIDGMCSMYRDLYEKYD